MTIRQAEYMINIANQMVDGVLNKERLLKTGDFSETEKALTNIHGIGSWTANYVLMHCLRFAMAFLIADVSLHHTMTSLLGMDRKKQCGF